jgi:hypothetical protein
MGACFTDPEIDSGTTFESMRFILKGSPVFKEAGEPLRIITSG